MPLRRRFPSWRERENQLLIVLLIIGENRGAGFSESMASQRKVRRGGSGAYGSARFLVCVCRAEPSPGRGSAEVAELIKWRAHCRTRNPTSKTFVRATLYQHFNAITLNKLHSIVGISYQQLVVSHLRSSTGQELLAQTLRPVPGDDPTVHAGRVFAINFPENGRALFCACFVQTFYNMVYTMIYNTR